MERATLNNPKQVKYEKRTERERQFSQLTATFLR